MCLPNTSAHHTEHLDAIRAAPNSRPCFRTDQLCTEGTMNQVAPPIVIDDPLTNFFYEGAKAGELRIQRCQDCSFYVHLPRPICRKCQSFNLVGEAVSGKAVLYTWSVATKPFHPFFVNRVPYLFATVELVEQPKLHLITNLVGIEEADVKIGMALEVDFEALSDTLTIPVFRPASA
jgi:uncharacterized protein